VHGACWVFGGRVVRGQEVVRNIETQMKDYKTFFRSLIKAEDLQGQDLIVNVESVTLEHLENDGKRERKLIARFTGMEKKLILNKTNAQSMADAFHTEHFDQWRGPVVLYPDTAAYRGKLVPCVRVRPANQQAREQGSDK
jgi:hypothetical protein